MWWEGFVGVEWFLCDWEFVKWFFEIMFFLVDVLVVMLKL